MKKILIFTLVLISFTAFSQGGKLQKANNYFDKLAYASASDIYVNLLGSEVDSPEMKSKLAYCYFQMGEITESEKIYADLVNSGASPTLDYYYYAQVLKQNGKYSESDKWMKKYHDLAKTDSRAKEFIENENYIQKIEKAGNKFSIKNLKVNTSDADFGGYYLGKKAYFISNRSDNPHVKNVWLWNNKRFLDMYSSDMDSTSELVNSKMHTKRVNTKFHEGPVCFSPDGKKVIFTRNNIASGKERRDNKGIQNLKLYIADVIQENIWLNEKEFQYNSKDFSIGHPTISQDGKFLYFVSDMPGGFGGADIYRVPILENFQFGKYENLGKTVNTEGQDMFPWINSENLLFFSSDGHVGLGGLDVFVAIPNVQGEYKKMLNVGKPVNSNRDDFAFIMDQSSRKGYFSSNRTGGIGDDDIYSYRLDKPFKAGIILKGTIKDSKTNEILANSDIILKDKDGNIVASIKSNDKGEYEFVLDDDSEYTLVGNQDKYKEEFAVIKTNSAISPEINQDLNLNKIPQISIYCVITDTKSKKALEGVNLSIVEIPSKSVVAETITPISGDFAKPMDELNVGDEITYEIRVAKPGYLTKITTFKYKIEKEGVINIHEKIDLSIGIIEVGGDLAKLIDVKPIYFDLGKFYIRPDAQIELDKIVKVMNEYPSMVVELGSHTDCRSSKAFNMKLSDKRAKASAAYIKARISKPERIYGKGYGEAKLINDCGCEGKVVTRNCSEEEHQQNRRTEFIIKKIGVNNVSVNKNVPETKGKLTYDPTKKFHIVEATDNLYIISVNNGVSVEEIKKLNNLKSEKVTVGQKLILRL